MTLTEKIFARASEKPQLSPGDNVWVNVDILMTHDVCGPGSFGIFKKEFGENAKVRYRRFHSSSRYLYVLVIRLHNWNQSTEEMKLFRIVCDVQVIYLCKFVNAC